MKRIASEFNAKCWDKAWEHTGGAWFEHPDFLDAVVAAFEAAGPLRAPLLDVGCGRGVLVSRMRAGLGNQVFGMDFSMNSLLQGDRNGVRARAEALPVRPQALNTILAVLLLEHLEEYQSFLREAFQALAPGGRIHLVFPNRFSVVTPVLYFKREILARRPMPWHKTISLAEASQALVQAGFRVTKSNFLSIGAYRGGLGRVVSGAIRLLLPVRFREEILLTAEKP